MPHMLFLDYCDPTTSARIGVSKWLWHEEIKDQFIVYPCNIWLLFNYLARVGALGLLQKLSSRLAERSRNKKVAGIGIGFLLNYQKGGFLADEQPLLFFASNHKLDAPVLVLDKRFLLPIATNNNSIPLQKFKFPDELYQYIAWTPFSGFPIDCDQVKTGLSKVLESVATGEISSFAVTNNFTDRLEARAPAPLRAKPTAVLFGLGNYAKTAILPNIRKSIDLRRVHEIDTDQLSFLRNSKNISLDTSPLPRANLKFDAWFIAGYHHTHSILAVSAISHGSVAVIEKPLATKRVQYDMFVAAIKQYSNSRFYLCFHKRYSKLHQLFKADMGAHVLGAPIDMHCIVYEIPLPRNHWYNWPNSGSRIVSNACHWIDYFMFVNDYCEVDFYKKSSLRGSDVAIQVCLKNGACFSMSLTDSGSQRLGVRDYIELRACGKTFTMIDGSNYMAEDRSRVFRRSRVNPLNAYACMYRQISQGIASGYGGDTVKSLRSSELTILLEELD